MSYTFTKSDYHKIAKTLEAKNISQQGNVVRFDIQSPNGQHSLLLEIFPSLAIGSRTGNLVQVTSPLGIAQLHLCTHFITGQDEVLFFAEQADKISGIAVTSTAGCNFYANVDKDLLQKDISKLAGEVMICVLQLSFSETVLVELK